MLAPVCLPVIKVVRNNMPINFEKPPEPERDYNQELADSEENLNRAAQAAHDERVKGRPWSEGLRQMKISVPRICLALATIEGGVAGNLLATGETTGAGILATVAAATAAFGLLVGRV